MTWYGHNPQHFVGRYLIEWAMFIMVLSNCYWIVSSYGSKIIGGRDANKGEFPSTLCFRGAVRCTATLVTLDTFLTASSCFQPIDDLSFIAILGGSVDIRDIETQQLYVKNYKRHKNYENRTTANGYILNDIAIGMLESSFVKSDTLLPAVFPAKDEAGMKAYLDNVKETKQKCLGTGYGATDVVDPESSISFVLKVVDIQLLPDEDCGIKDDRVGKEVCGTGVEHGDGAFYGDTGGTLTCGGKIIGMAQQFTEKEKDGKTIKVVTFLMFGPYFDYFGIGYGERWKPLPLHLVIFLSLIVSKIYR